MIGFGSLIKKYVLDYNVPSDLEEGIVESVHIDKSERRISLNVSFSDLIQRKKICHVEELLKKSKIVRNRFANI